MYVTLGTAVVVAFIAWGACTMYHRRKEGGRSGGYGYRQKDDTTDRKRR